MSLETLKQEMEQRVADTVGCDINEACEIVSAIWPLVAAEVERLQRERDEARAQVDALLETSQAIDIKADKAESALAALQQKVADVRAWAESCIRINGANEWLPPTHVLARLPAPDAGAKE